jgi:hypothetical protein
MSMIFPKKKSSVRPRLSLSLDERDVRMLGMNNWEKNPAGGLRELGYATRPTALEKLLFEYCIFMFAIACLICCDNNDCDELR